MVFSMSLVAIKELIHRQVLDEELIQHFVDLRSGHVIHRFESEYWDYKRELCDIDASEKLAELAADVLAFHNSRGGYIIFGITDDFAVLGIHDDGALEIDSNKLNKKLRKYIGESFHCRYAAIASAIGGTRKTLSVILVPPRNGIGVRTGCAAPGAEPMFKKGELFLRANDRKKRAETDADLLYLFSPPEPEVIVGPRQLRIDVPRPGFRLFRGDYGRFVGDTTREPKIARTIEELVLGKWDIVLLRGVGGVGKTAVAIEATQRIATDPSLKDAFGGIISLSAKSEQLTPFDRNPIEPEISSYDQFVHQILVNCDWDGDIPKQLYEKENLVRRLLKEKNILLFIDNFETIESRESRISQFILGLPPGTKTLITSRHLPQDLPVLAIDIPPLDRREAEILALAEATDQRIGTATTDRFLDQIITISGRIPLAIKWIISCSKNADHLRQLMEEHGRGKPKLQDLSEFCFTFEYNLLSPTARTALILFPVFRKAPTLAELAVAAEIPGEQMRAALDELIDFSLVIPEHSQARNEEVFRILSLTASFAESKLVGAGDLERQAKRRLRAYYGGSIPELLVAAEDLLSRGSTAAARKYIDEEILTRDENNASAFYIRAKTFEQDFNYTAAIKNYQLSLTNAGRNSALVAESALRISALARIEPQISSEDVIPLLEKAHSVSQDMRLALELAKTFSMLGKASLALEYSQKVFQNYSAKNRDHWEDAVVFICRDQRSNLGDEVALAFIRKALKLCPDSRVIARWEQKLMEALGLLDYKGGRRKADG